MKDDDAKVDVAPVKADVEPEAKRTTPVAIELEVSRQRAASWTVFGIIFGALLIWKLGTVGVWAGILLIVLGLFRAYELVQTFMYPPGTIEVTDTKVVLPRGLSMGKPLQLTPKDITSVYFLRRSVPWNRSAPVLVIELVGGRALAFPRDWFASEADQRHVVHALLHRIPALTGTLPPETAQHDEGNTLLWVQLIGGIVLLVGGVVAWVMASTPISNAQYAMYVTPIVAGWIFAWRGLMRW